MDDYEKTIASVLQDSWRGPGKYVIHVGLVRIRLGRAESKAALENLVGEKIRRSDADLSDWYGAQIKKEKGQCGTIC